MRRLGCELTAMCSRRKARLTFWLTRQCGQLNFLRYKELAVRPHHARVDQASRSTKYHTMFHTEQRQHSRTGFTGSPSL